MNSQAPTPDIDLTANDTNATAKRVTEVLALGPPLHPLDVDTRWSQVALLARSLSDQG